MEETTAELEEQVTFMRSQVSITQSKVREVESGEVSEVSCMLSLLGVYIHHYSILSFPLSTIHKYKVSTLREELAEQKSISERKQQELDSMTSSRNKYRTKWEQTEEKLSRKETELHEVRVRMETKAEENKKCYEALMKEKEEAQATLATTLQRVS